MPCNEPGSNQILSHLTSSAQKIRSVYQGPKLFLKLKCQGKGRIECPHLWQTLNWPAKVPAGSFFPPVSSVFSSDDSHRFTAGLISYSLLKCTISPHRVKDPDGLVMGKGGRQQNSKL